MGVRVGQVSLRHEYCGIPLPSIVNTIVTFHSACLDNATGQTIVAYHSGSP